MQIVLRGTAAGYEAEHTARIFFPGAEKATQVPETGDFVLAASHEKPILCCCAGAMRFAGAPQCGSRKPMQNTPCAACFMAC